MEKVVFHHLQTEDINEIFRSAFKAHYYSESALLDGISDLWQTRGIQQSFQILALQSVQWTMASLTPPEHHLGINESAGF